MALGSALKKITTRAKQIRKRKPGKSWKAAVKQAGAEYRGGKLKNKKKRVAKVGAVKTKKRRAPRKRSAKRRTSSKPIVRTRTLTVVKYRTRTVRAKRKVSRVGRSGKGSKLLLIGGLAVGGLLLYSMLKPRTTAALVTRTTPAASSAAANIVAVAQAAGIVGAQLQKIIDSMNSKDDATIVAANSQSGGDPGFLVDYFG